MTTSRSFTPQQFGAVGDGQRDDTEPFRQALNLARHGGALRIPAGDYRITEPLLTYPLRSLAIVGEGEGVSKLIFDNADGLLFNFHQVGAQQPHGLTIEGVGLQAKGECGRAFAINYGAPLQTSDHYRSSLRLTNVLVESGDLGSWGNGIDIADAWNATLDNVYVSGSSAGGVWNNLQGVGINFRRMCVNAHLTNCRTNFWKTGIQAHAEEHNTEGIAISNCSQVGVQRGIWIKGNPNITHAPRISTVSVVGGLIEARVGGVVGGSAGVHLENCWDAKIVGVEMLTETITLNVESTYGVIAQGCKNLIVDGCGFNAWTNGICLTDECPNTNIDDNVFTNCKVNFQAP